MNKNFMGLYTQMDGFTGFVARVADRVAVPHDSLKQSIGSQVEDDATFGSLHSKSQAMGSYDVSDHVDVIDKTMDSTDRRFDQIMQILLRIEAKQLSALSRRKSGASSSDVWPSALLSSSRSLPILARDTEKIVATASDPIQSMAMPRFNGSSPFGWLLKVEKYFQSCQVIEDERLGRLSECLEGEAFFWYKKEIYFGGFRTWCEFKRRLVAHFSPVKRCSRQAVKHKPMVTSKTDEEPESSAVNKHVETEEDFIQQLVVEIAQEKTPASESLVSASVLESGHNENGLEDFGYTSLNVVRKKVVSKVLHEIVDDLPSKVDKSDEKSHGVLCTHSASKVLDTIPLKTEMMNMQMEQDKLSKSWKFKFKNGEVINEEGSFATTSCAKAISVQESHYNTEGVVKSTMCAKEDSGSSYTWYKQRQRKFQASGSPTTMVHVVVQDTIVGQHMNSSIVDDHHENSDVFLHRESVREITLGEISYGATGLINSELIHDTRLQNQMIPMIDHEEDSNKLFPVSHVREVKEFFLNLQSKVILKQEPTLVMTHELDLVQRQEQVTKKMKSMQESESRVHLQDQFGSIWGGFFSDFYSGVLSPQMKFLKSWMFKYKLEQYALGILLTYSEKLTFMSNTNARELIEPGKKKILFSAMGPFVIDISVWPITVIWYGLTRKNHTANWWYWAPVFAGDRELNQLMEQFHDNHAKARLKIMKMQWRLFLLTPLNQICGKSVHYSQLKGVQNLKTLILWGSVSLKLLSHDDMQLLFVFWRAVHWWNAAAIPLEHERSRLGTRRMWTWCKLWHFKYKHEMMWSCKSRQQIMVSFTKGITLFLTLWVQVREVGVFCSQWRSFSVNRSASLTTWIPQLMDSPTHTTARVRDKPDQFQYLVRFPSYVNEMRREADRMDKSALQSVLLKLGAEPTLQQTIDLSILEMEYPWGTHLATDYLLIHITFTSMAQRNVTPDVHNFFGIWHRWRSRDCLPCGFGLVTTWVMHLTSFSSGVVVWFSSLLCMIPWGLFIFSA